MSLDVYLTVDHTIPREKSGIFIRRHGEMVEISESEWEEMCPGHKPAIAEQITVKREVYSANITHNLNRMADASGIYEALWRPDEVGITKASQLIEPLERGLALLQSDPPRFEAFNSPNGWGLYKHFVPFVENYLAACREAPDADVRVSR